MQKRKWTCASSGLCLKDLRLVLKISNGFYKKRKIELEYLVFWYSSEYKNQTWKADAIGGYLLFYDCE